MPARDDSELIRRWKRFLVPAETLGKLAQGEVTAKRTLAGAKFLGASFYHDKALIAMFFERDDFPATHIGEDVPTEELQVESTAPVIRIFH